MKKMSDQNRLKLHIMPTTGWMNDPNGLCQFHGTYHVFFQYSPEDARGGLKAWGHITTKDFVHWDKQETALLPDKPFDKDGVYSGSALISADKMYLIYTGNAKQEGNYDYITKGREANTVVVESPDGIHFSEKKLVMTNADYPSDYSCHIRDPKVWQQGNTYYMVQGGRKLSDKGAILLLSSQDMYHWTFEKEMTTHAPFGYMWECPDYFKLDGNIVLSFSPQGLSAREFYYQNVYQSGYFLLDEEYEIPEKACFTEWDMGFDFYAPQTFEDEKGRRILIGWAGIPDADYDNEPTVKCGWQHALTLPRELTFKDGKVLQNPVEEIKTLRQRRCELEERKEFAPENNVFELEIVPKKDADFYLEYDCHAGKTPDVELNFHKTDSQAGIFSLQLSKEAGRGRTIRKAQLQNLKNIRIIMDTSMVEIYLNDGETVFTSRFYMQEENRKLWMDGTSEAALWYLSGMEGL